VHYKFEFPQVVRLGFYTHPVSVSALLVTDFALSSLWIFFAPGRGAPGSHEVRFYTHPVSVSALFVADFVLSSLWILLPQGGGAAPRRYTVLTCIT